MGFDRFSGTRKCHRCAADMGGIAWLCPSCRAQNRIYTMLQMGVSIVLALVGLSFMDER